MKKILFIMAAILSMVAISCTQNQRARNLGGTMEVKVKPGYKVTMATWKNDDLFYMIEEMDSSYFPKKKILVEEASFGIFQTEVTFTESR